MLKPEIESRGSAIDTVFAPLGADIEQLNKHLAKAEISRNAFLLTVSLLTMAKMEKAENVMLGWVYHGRDSRNKDGTIGLLIKEIPLGLSLGELTDVRSMYASVKKQMSMGLTYRDYPYTFRNSSAALNDVFCVIDEGDLMDLQCIKGVPCEEVTLSKSAGAMGWLMALLFLNMGGIYLSMNYTSTRYNRSTIDLDINRGYRQGGAFGQRLCSTHRSHKVPRRRAIHRGQLLGRVIADGKAIGLGQCTQRSVRCTVIDEDRHVLAVGIGGKKFFSAHHNVDWVHLNGLSLGSKCRRHQTTQKSQAKNNT